MAWWQRHWSVGLSGSSVLGLSPAGQSLELGEETLLSVRGALFTHMYKWVPLNLMGQGV